jgi:adenylate cyclase
MSSASRRDVIAIILVALACGFAVVLPPFSFIHNWSIDVLTVLRWEAFGARRDPASSPVVVIAIDEQTSETPPFKGSPIPT